MARTIKEIDFNGFFDLLQNNKNKYIVKFGTPWCKPCIELNSLLSKLPDDQYNNIYEIDYTEHMDNLIDILNISIEKYPTLIFYNNTDLDFISQCVFREENASEVMSKIDYFFTNY